MTQSYLIFSQFGKMEILKSSGKKIIAEHGGISEVIEGHDWTSQIGNLIYRWERGDFPELKFSAPNAKALFKIVKSAYNKFIVAAGGLVTDRSGKLLLIFRNGKWDLPKGKIENGESTEQGALREVAEETGLKRLKIKREFFSTYHTYVISGKSVLKETVWFLMIAGDDKIKLQSSEGITSFQWITADMIEGISGNTYENILLLVNTYFKV